MPLMIDEDKEIVVIKYSNVPDPTILGFDQVDSLLVRRARNAADRNSLYLIDKSRKEHFLKTGDREIIKEAAKSLGRSFGNNVAIIDVAAPNNATTV